MYKIKIIKNNFFFIIFIILILFIFDAFTNTYIVLRENHHLRMLKGAGFCDKTGYGFHKNILKKFTYIDENLKVINFNNFPGSEGYFFDYKKKSTGNYILLISADKGQLKSYIKNNYKLLYTDKDCYFLSK